MIRINLPLTIDNKNLLNQLGADGTGTSNGIDVTNVNFIDTGLITNFHVYVLHYNTDGDILPELSETFRDISGSLSLNQGSSVENISNVLARQVVEIVRIGDNLYARFVKDEADNLNPTFQAALDQDGASTNLIISASISTDVTSSNFSPTDVTIADLNLKQRRIYYGLERIVESLSYFGGGSSGNTFNITGASQQYVLDRIAIEAAQRSAADATFRTQAQIDTLIDDEKPRDTIINRDPTTHSASFTGYNTNDIGHFDRNNIIFLSQDFNPNRLSTIIRHDLNTIERTLSITRGNTILNGFLVIRNGSGYNPGVLEIFLEGYQSGDTLPNSHEFSGVIYQHPQNQGNITINGITYRRFTYSELGNANRHAGTFNYRTVGDSTISFVATGQTGARLPTRIGEGVVVQQTGQRWIAISIDPPAWIKSGTISTQLFNPHIVQEYNSAFAYSRGQFCTFDRNIYVCTTSLTAPEVFDGSKWLSIASTSGGTGGDSTVLTGTELPNDEIGEDDNIYIKVNENRVFRKVESVWVEVGNIVKLLNRDPVSILTPSIPYRTQNTFFIFGAGVGSDDPSDISSSTDISPDAMFTDVPSPGYIFRWSSTEQPTIIVTDGQNIRVLVAGTYANTITSYPSTISITAANGDVSLYTMRTISPISSGTIDFGDGNGSVSSTRIIYTLTSGGLGWTTSETVTISLGGNEETRIVETFAIQHIGAIPDFVGQFLQRTDIDRRYISISLTEWQALPRTSAGTGEPPEDGIENDIYFQRDGSIYIHDGTEWVARAAGSATAALSGDDRYILDNINRNITAPIFTLPEWNAKADDRYSGYSHYLFHKSALSTGNAWGGPAQYTTGGSVSKIVSHLMYALLDDCSAYPNSSNNVDCYYIQSSVPSSSVFPVHTVCGVSTSIWTQDNAARRISSIIFRDTEGLARQFDYSGPDRALTAADDHSVAANYTEVESGDDLVLLSDESLTAKDTDTLSFSDKYNPIAVNTNDSIAGDGTSDSPLSISATVSRVSDIEENTKFIAPYLSQETQAVIEDYFTDAAFETNGGYGVAGAFDETLGATFLMNNARFINVPSPFATPPERIGEDADSSTATPYDSQISSRVQYLYHNRINDVPAYSAIKACAYYGISNTTRLITLVTDDSGATGQIVFSNQQRVNLDAGNTLASSSYEGHINFSIPHSRNYVDIMGNPNRGDVTTMNVFLLNDDSGVISITKLIGPRPVGGSGFASADTAAAVMPTNDIPANRVPNSEVKFNYDSVNNIMEFWFNVYNEHGVGRYISVTYTIDSGFQLSNNNFTRTTPFDRVLDSRIKEGAVAIRGVGATRQVFLRDEIEHLEVRTLVEVAEENQDNVGRLEDEIEGVIIPVGEPLNEHDDATYILKANQVAGSFRE